MSFPVFDPEVPEPLIESIQIWRWYDARELLLFVDTYVLILFIVVGVGIVAAELVRMVREHYNPASPYKLYGASNQRFAKKAD